MDAGAPMPNNTLPNRTDHDLAGPAADLPEGGFGWFLIRDLAQDVEYRRAGAQNVLNLRLDLALS